MSKNEYYHQGDLLIVRIGEHDPLEVETEQSSRSILKGESAHEHVITGDISHPSDVLSIRKGMKYRRPISSSNHLGLAFVGEGGAYVWHTSEQEGHPDHDRIELKPGLYQFGRQQEAGLNGAIRYVAD